MLVNDNHKPEAMNPNGNSTHPQFTRRPVRRRLLGLGLVTAALGTAMREASAQENVIAYVVPAGTAGNQASL